ncbi:CsgG/HfaB family protein [Rubrivivax rivuli]|uniref:Curli production assembly/transport component CsgG n=1 Tax=Rubrivivax rivuli TaxID=1862385 RepID=A0A437RHH5_9BURK|nr:CsgG/HfaB family protein [Rubrivivax rivuli]RVU46237.1 hypothetical protein EOE66_10305 [Rubrivivax rivuli]
MSRPRSPGPRPPRAQGCTGRRRFVVALGVFGWLATGAHAQNPALPAVVVWDYENQGTLAAPQAAHADFLRRSLSESLTATLLQVPGLPVVERQRLKDLLAEQKLGSTALADDDARLRLGKIVGAQRMVFGGFFVLGDQVQVHVRVIDTATSRVLFSDEAVAALATVMTQVASLNERLARALGGAAVVAQGHPPERWQAYDRALALADAGDFDAAITALQQLLAADKNFLPAERQLVALLERGARR